MADTNGTAAQTVLEIMSTEEMEAGCAAAQRDLLDWLERGMPNTQPTKAEYREATGKTNEKAEDRELNQRAIRAADVWFDRLFPLPESTRGALKAAKAARKGLGK